MDSFVSNFYINELSNLVVFLITSPFLPVNLMNFFLSQCKNLNKNSVFLKLNIEHSFPR